MNKKIIAGLVMTMLVSQVSFANETHTHLSRYSLRVASQLNDIAQQNNSDICAGDIMIAAAYVKSAGYALSKDKITPARVSLVYGQNELKEIIHSRSYCAQVAAQVKPSLAEIIIIQGELDAENVEQGPDNTSD